MDLNLSGKHALVTGSTLGIGRAIAETLLTEGASVIINGRDRDRLAEVVAALNPLGQVRGVAADLSAAAGAEALLHEINRPVDILVNNVGVFTVRPFFEISDTEWTDMFQLNVMSGVRLARALMPAMLESSWGRVIFIGSDQSVKPNPLMAHYAMTKTAQVSIARSLAELTAGTGVTVNTVLSAPTWTDGVEAFMTQMAEMEDTTPEAMSEEYFGDGEGRTSLLQRWADPAEISALVAFICSPRASATNGAALRADGGMLRSLF
ncbi:MAG: SDR family oxidoreductase [Pseudomonadota bacterium]|nr:SDR family oxidoreductase [Pseudomonadota bacterium]